MTELKKHILNAGSFDPGFEWSAGEHYQSVSYGVFSSSEIVGYDLEDVDDQVNDQICLYLDLPGVCSTTDSVGVGLFTLTYEDLKKMIALYEQNIGNQE